jgi:hypothetical protein
MKDSRRRLLAALVLGIAVAGGWFAYAPALGGPFLLDDFSNLGGLASVEDTRSALIFAFSGFAGPLGRPLALAKFLPQAAAWGEAAEPFLRVNILIHLLNACVLAWVLHRLAIVSRVREEKALFVAIAAASLWLFLPLLASASLLVVQRMTTLSALFVLLGLAGYLHARQPIVTICAFTSDPTPAPLFRLAVRPNERNGLKTPSRNPGSAIKSVASTMRTWCT